MIIKNIKSNKHQKDYTLSLIENENSWEGKLIYSESQEPDISILTQNFKENSIDEVIEKVNEFFTSRGHYITIYSPSPMFVGRRIDFEINEKKKSQPIKLLSGHFIYIRPHYEGLNYEQPDELDKVILDTLQGGMTSGHELNIQFKDFKMDTSREGIESWKSMISGERKNSLHIQSSTIPEDITPTDVMGLPNNYTIKESTIPIYFHLTHSHNDAIEILIPKSFQLNTKSEHLLNLFNGVKRIAN